MCFAHAGNEVCLVRHAHCRCVVPGGLGEKVLFEDAIEIDIQGFLPSRIIAHAKSELQDHHPVKPSLLNLARVLTTAKQQLGVLAAKTTPLPPGGVNFQWPPPVCVTSQPWA